MLRIAAIKQREETPKTSSHENQPEPNQDRRQEPKQTRQYVSSCVQIIRAGSYLATSAAVERPALLAALKHRGVGLSQRQAVATSVAKAVKAGSMVAVVDVSDAHAALLGTQRVGVVVAAREQPL